MNLFIITVLISFFGIVRLDSNRSETFPYRFGYIKSHRNFTLPEYRKISVQDKLIPLSFDSSETWPQCANIINDIKDQGNCSSCWAVATTSMISDRICISSNGQKQIKISALDVMTCFEGDRSYHCQGGDPIFAIDYWIKYGIVSGGNKEDKGTCRPYQLNPKCTDDVCPEKYECKKYCENDEDYNRNRYFGKRRRLIEMSELEIRKEIMTNGPVVASFLVFQSFIDFFENNRTGVYKSLANNDEKPDGHSVKITGWGTDADGTKFWLIANSWGVEFGDRGFFRIRSGVNLLGIESDVLAAEPVIL